MAIHNEVIAEISSGFSKKIEKGAEEQIFDLLQKSQYQHPIKSAIREVVSNGLDSIREKNVAISILKGNSKVEDHYITREGDVYKDSKFDPSYYNLDFLSSENTVEVIYCDGGDLGKDTVIMRDHGVGLGGSRLEGYFNIGYSSKRLNKYALGKFGLGAKSPLATNVPYYTVTNRYNGKEYVFNIYARKIDSLVPQFDLEKMIENPSFQFSNGYKGYYRNTNEKNMLQVEIICKKHHKQKYIDAVTSQMLYFDNVRLFEKSVNGQITEIPVKADILYEDDLIVLSRNSPYSKPHLLLNGVNYGYIDFQELELEQKLGNIGIKVAPEKVSVNPSRESLIWDDVTRKVVVDKFQEVVSIASETINRELKETDFLKWVRVCATAVYGAAWSNGGQDSVLGRLFQVVDMSKVELTYQPNPAFKYNYNLLNGLQCHTVTMKSTREGSKLRKKVDYNPHWTRAMADSLPIILTRSNFSNRKNKYILTHKYPQGFISLKLEVIKEDGSLVQPEDAMETKMMTSLKEEIAGFITLSKEKKEERIKSLSIRIADLHNFILASADQLWYEDIEVPEDFKANEEEEETEDETETQEAQLSAAERRKLEGSTIVHSPRQCYNMPAHGRPFEMQKIEVQSQLIDTWSNPEIFYSSNDFEPLLMTAALMTRPGNGVGWEFNYNGYQDRKLEATNYNQWRDKGYKNVRKDELDRLPWFYDNDPVRLIKVAQDNVKYYRDFKHITRFFKEIRKKTITMSNALIRWNTARIINEKLSDLKFLNGFSQLSQEKANAYQRLIGYVTKYFRRLDVNKDLMGADDSTVNGVVSHLDKVGAFQLFVRENPEDKEAIAEFAQKLFNPQKGVEIEDGCAIDVEIYDLYKELLDWAQPVQTLMNVVTPLTHGLSLTNEQEEEVRHYFQYRNCPI